MSFSREIIDFNKSIVSKLENINEPLMKNFGIFLFTYRRLNKNGTLFHLTTKDDWIEKSVQNNLLVSSEILPKIYHTINTSKQNFLWTGNLKDPLYNSLHSFDIWNGITFYENYENYIEIIAFASTRNNTSVQNFYINNFELLHYFKSYFINEINNIIIYENFNKLSINIKDKIPIFIENKCLKNNHINFINETKLTRYYFSFPYEHVYLTRREAEVLFYITQGMSCKNIARILKNCIEKEGKDKISDRTVESYWNIIKSKLQTSDRSKIINIFLSSRIPDAIAYTCKIMHYVRDDT